MVLVRRSVELSTLEAHHDVAGFILAVVGVVYAVLLAFVVVIVWQQFDSSRSDADREATIVLALYQDAAVLDDVGPDARPASAATRRASSTPSGSRWRKATTRAGRPATPSTTSGPRSARWSRAADSDIAFYDQAVESLHEVSELRRTGSSPAARSSRPRCGAC